MSRPLSYLGALPKTGTTAICQALGQIHLHHRAVEVPGPCWGTTRHPVSWYRSVWWWHAQYRRRGNLADLERCVRGMAGLDMELDLEPLIHARRPFGFEVGGDWRREGLWTRCHRYWFQREGAWAVEALVRRAYLADAVGDFGVPAVGQVNVAPRLPPLSADAVARILRYDGSMMLELGYHAPTGDDGRAVWRPAVAHVA